MICFLEYFWCQRDNFYELFIMKFMSYWFKNMCIDRLFVVVVQKNISIIIEVNDRIVWVMNIFFGVYYYCFQYIIFFDFIMWNCFFDGDFDDVVYVCVVMV